MIEGGRVAIRCGYCGRLIREADVDPGGETMAVIGPISRDGTAPQDYARTYSRSLADLPLRRATAPESVPDDALTGRRVGRGADCFDASPASPGAWNPADVTRYRFVCRGPRHRHGKTLDRPVRAERLLELCVDALRSPGAASEVTLL